MSEQKLSAEMWLHILSKTVANYAAAGGRVSVVNEYEFGAVGVYLNELSIDDELLHPDFRALVGAHYRCLDCGHNVEDLGEEYMVFDDVWEAGGGGEGRLCVGCLELRLGRELGPADFTHVYTNLVMEEEGYKSERLIHRLSGGRAE